MLPLVRAGTAILCLVLCCPLTLVVSCGTSGIEGAASTNPGLNASRSDASPSTTSVVSSTDLDGGEEVTTDANGDAGGGGDAGADAACVPTVIDDALSTIDLSRWLPSPSMGGFPKADPNAPGMAKPMIALIDPMKASQRGGLWLNTPVPTHAFDVTFDYFIDCPNNDFCADGLAAGWIDTTSALDLAGGNGGGALALPNKNGGAVTITMLKNMTSGYTLNPVTLATRTITTSAPGDSTMSIADDSLVKQLRTASLRLRNGKVSVTIGGLTITGTTASDFTGYFGFTAATGTNFDGVYISSFHGEFYDCDPPH
jgi:hypothetical protein